MRLARRLFCYMQIVLIAAACASKVRAADEPSPQIIGGSIGFDGAFKVGHWTPILVGAVGDVEAVKPTVRVTTLDNDGIAMSIAVPIPLDAGSAEGVWPVLLYTRVGRLDAGVKTSLIAQDGTVLHQRDFAAALRDDDRPYTPLPATGQLIVQAGRGSLGLVEALADRESEHAGARAVVRVDDIDLLPPDWFGYDGVDVIVLATSDLAFCERLAADARRRAALRRWLELGGRLVICGGRNAPQLLAAGRPLATFVPGTIVEQVRLPQTRSVESYAGSTLPLHSGPTPPEIFVPLVSDVRGRVELFGQGEAALPLVIRAPYGLGEVAFVCLDLDGPQLAAWSGRTGLVRAVVRPYLVQGQSAGGKQSLVSLGYDDLAGALRQRLGRAFVGVTPITFPLVAASIIAYLLVLGPLDYLFVDRFVRRRWVAWVTFPLVVLATCAAAVWAARATKDRVGERLNAVELVDFDLTTGVARGTCWAALYTSDARRYDLHLEPSLPNGAPAATSQLASLGLPGAGIGGMHARGLDFELTPTGYSTSPDLEQLYGVPILTAATKSFLARWETSLAADRPLCEASLSVDEDGLLVGTFVNRTGAPLRNAYLLHGQWGYMLGNLDDGAEIAVGPQLTANRTRTLVLRRAGHAADDSAPGRGVFLADRASLDELLNVMMFYEAAGGYDFAGLPNRYQSFCDLSRLLEFDRAILIANADGPSSRWIDNNSNQPLSSDDEDMFHNVTYRFVCPIDNGPRIEDSPRRTTDN